MSVLLQGVPAMQGGKTIRILVGAEPPDHFHNGLPYDADGSLAVESAPAVTHHHQGLPFSVNKRLAVFVNGVVTSVQPGAMPFVGPHLALSTGVVDHVSSGVQYTAGQQIAVVI